MIKDKMTLDEYLEFLKVTGNSKGRKNKYSAIRTEVDGIKFDSKHESDRYGILKIRHKAGEISLPIYHYVFQLVGCTYECDFLYLDYRQKRFIVEDAKGVRTDVYKIKKRQMKELYDIDILET